MSERRTAAHRAVSLEYATIAWNAVEVAVTLALGITAGSLALVAFGLDSLVEIFASLVVVWHLRGERTAPARTDRALRLVAVAFFVLAGLLFAGAVAALLSERRADDSPLGIAYLALTGAAMFTLAWRKRRVADAAESHPLVHEARITFLDGTLAAAILLALAANAALGWWWADPGAALLVAATAVYEGIQAPRKH